MSSTKLATDAGIESDLTEQLGPIQDPILDYKDNHFEEKFSSPSVVIETVADAMVAINKYQETSGNILAMTRTRGSARAFACISHANCPFSANFGSSFKHKGIIYKPNYCTVQHHGTIVVFSKGGQKR
ncbi:hypothetical protein IV203_031036 [Nitzschia inconspicua]|uniref:Uncharacterized protein n=1 Tax=Nitzschia inconspicua TaxID=303405 RepID=A0A9K3Q296_9STRA|nr:hypothetical protein IV203_031036 [Nitzschia inconspicua]